MRLAEHLSLFLNKFNKFNNKGAQMLDSIYQVIKVNQNCFFGVKTSCFLPSFTQGYNGRHYVTLVNL